MMFRVTAAALLVLSTASVAFAQNRTLPDSDIRAFEPPIDVTSQQIYGGQFNGRVYQGRSVSQPPFVAVVPEMDQ